MTIPDETLWKARSPHESESKLKEPKQNSTSLAVAHVIKETLPVIYRLSCPSFWMVSNASSLMFGPVLG